MPEELANNAVISLEEMRGFLQRGEGEHNQDEEIVRLINAASDEFAHGYPGREFAPRGETAAAREFVHVGGHLELAPYDVREVQAVTLGTDLAAEKHVELEASEWRLRPRPARHGVFQAIKLQPDRELDLPCEFEVTVTGLWGFPAVPEDVKHWCKVTVATWLRKDVAAYSTTLRADEDRLERPDALPTAAYRALRKYHIPGRILPR